MQVLSAADGEFNIGGARRGDQLWPALSLGADCGYLVWQDNSIDGLYGTGIAAMRLDSTLATTGAVLRVSQQLPGNQEKPQVVRLSSGGAMFAWETRNGIRQSIYTRFLDDNGAFITGDVQASPSSWTNSVKYLTNWYAYSKNKWKPRKLKLVDRTYNIREQVGGLATAALPDGGAVVAYHSGRRYETNTWGMITNVHWTGNKAVTNGYLRPLLFRLECMQDVFFQRFDSTGQKVGGEILVNQFTDYNQRSPAIASLSSGNFVVVWVCERPRSLSAVDNFRVDLVARLFNGQGEALGNEFMVASGEDVANANPAVAALPSGGFTVLWSQQGGGFSRRWDVYCRTFGADGTASGSMFRVNTYLEGDQFAPRVASTGENQLVVWTSVGQDGSREGVYGRWLVSGVPSGDEFRVNTTTISRQIQPAVATDGQSRVLAVWASYVGETGFDLFGKQIPVGGSPQPASGGGNESR